MTLDFEALRKMEFPATKAATHLKASGGSPMCFSAYKESEIYVREMCFEGDIYYTRYLDGVDNARRLVAEYIGAGPDEIGFHVNSSSAAAVVARMLKKQGVERVYFPVGEFPTSVHTIRNLQMDAVPVGDPGFRDAPGDWLDAIDADLKGEGAGKKSALVASHVGFLSGTAIDIPAFGEFCQERDLTFVVNATQSFGALDIDVGENVAMLFGTGLKWAAAGYGAGFLYIRQALVDTVGLEPATGWLSVTDPYAMDHRNADPIQAARSLDAGGGMPQFGPLLALNGALRLYERMGNGNIREGVSAVQERTLALAGDLRSALIDAGFDVIGDRSTPPKSGIVSLVADDAGRIHHRLQREDILTSLRSFPDSREERIIRFGIHYFNIRKEIDKALEVLKKGQ